MSIFFPGSPYIIFISNAQNRKEKVEEEEMPTCTNINYHLEAQRRQRRIERRNEALQRLQQAQVMIRNVLGGPTSAFHNLSLVFTIKHPPFSFKMLVKRQKLDYAFKTTVFV